MERRIEYYVKPEEKIVVARGKKETYKTVFNESLYKCSDTTAKVIDMFLDNSNTKAFPFEVDIVNGKDFIGIAKCDDEDEFNEYIGKDIAAAKADLKYHSAISKKYSQIIRTLQRVINELTKLKEYHDRKKENILNDFDRYYK